MDIIMEKGNKRTGTSVSTPKKFDEKIKALNNSDVNNNDIYEQYLQLLKRKSTSDSTPKKFEEAIKKLYNSYVNNDKIEQDFKKLKSSERIQFLRKMAPYFIPKFCSESEKKIVVGPDREREKKIRDEYYSRFSDEELMELVPSDIDGVESTETWADFYGIDLKKRQLERETKSQDTSDSTLEKSNEKIKKMFDSYMNSKLFEYDFNKLNSLECIKFIQEMAPYFMPKAKIDNVERYDMYGEDYKDLIRVYPGIEKFLKHKKIYWGEKPNKWRR